MMAWELAGWAEYCVAFVVFFAAHNIPTRPSVKTAITARIGARGFGIGYGLVSLVALYWLLMSAGRAPIVEVWAWAPWQNMVPVIAMIPVCAILCFGLARPNPFSFGGRKNDQFDPREPGLIRLIRHPALAALALWAAAHTVANGHLAHVIMFGVFTLFALLGMRMIDRRKQREMPDWSQQLSAMRASSLRSTPRHRGSFTIRLGLSILLYIALLRGHGLIIGVYPLG